MRRPSRGKLFQGREITSNESLLFRPAPFLQLALVLDRVGDTIEPLRENQCHRTPGCSEATKRSRIMLSNPYFKRGSRRSDVEASIGTAEDVEKSSFHHFHILRTNPSS